ncbi:MAG: tRNA 2-thiouridine(34) synthase MnmA, partial [bacterium]|nr:tRNA 2-thiouridine(34) synthase MnmA [bacterium]
RIWNKHKQSNTPLKRKVFVAMSGGVDSSVAAALLKKRGFKVVGVFFKPWQPKKGVEFCNWKEDRQDALAAASTLGIPFKTWDFSKEYKEKVGDYMIDAYREGITPNPDVMCNKEIKFGIFLKKALAEGADFIATGHYVRLKRTSGKLKVFKVRKVSELDKPDELYKLYTARDSAKDQSYFLWTLTQKELKHCLFPVGDYAKPEIRKMAKKFGLPNHDKKDSQGVCFIGQLNMRDFLKYYIKPKPGKIKLLKDSEVVGEHEGVYFYTIGQRHGLNISNGQGPYYVTGKDLKKNIVYVSTNSTEDLESREVYISDTSWVGNNPKFPGKINIKARYRTKEIGAKISRSSKGVFKLVATTPIRAITPGQSVVFYRGQEMLGGGVIVH